MKSAMATRCAGGLALLTALAAFTPLAAALPVVAHSSEKHRSPKSFLETRSDVAGNDDDAAAQAVIQAAEQEETTGSGQAVAQVAQSDASGEESTKHASSSKHVKAGAAPASEEDEEEDDKDDSKDDEEDEEDESTTKAPTVKMRKQKKAFSPAPAPAQAPEEDDEDEDEPVTGYQAPVVAVVTIKNVDYDVLVDDQSLHAEIEKAVRDSIADEAGDDIDSDDVSLVSWPGSVRARAVVKPAEGISSKAVLSELKNSTELNAMIAERVSKIKGIDKATKGDGDITVEVDVLVATKTSSVSRVMTRAKGQKHLSRVFELETKAADARQEIGEIAGEELAIDDQIKDLENEPKFTKMVDERVKKVEGELQAPVFAETIGQMWKELRMFGTPCLIKHLREEKAQVKVRIFDAEVNATNVEKELQAARGDVKEAWYPTPTTQAPPKSLATSLSGYMAILMALGCAALS